MFPPCFGWAFTELPHTHTHFSLWPWHMTHVIYSLPEQTIWYSSLYLRRSGLRCIFDVLSWSQYALMSLRCVLQPACTEKLLPTALSRTAADGMSECYRWHSAYSDAMKCKRWAVSCRTVEAVGEQEGKKCFSTMWKSLLPPNTTQKTPWRWQARIVHCVDRLLWTMMNTLINLMESFISGW